MARLTARRRVLLRLLLVQAAWSYERMQGVGLGWASEPALRGLFGTAARYHEALARATGFFNAHPYFAALAVGAELRAEADGVAGPQIERLRTALCGSLGGLGDRLFWSGVVPALVAATLIGVVLGLGLWALAGALILYNVGRLALSRRLLDLGWAHGLGVGGAVTATGLPRAGSLAVAVAGVLGFALLPVAGAWLLEGAARADLGRTAAFGVGLLLARGLLGPRASALKLTVLLATAVILWQAVTA